MADHLRALYRRLPFGLRQAVRDLLPSRHKLLKRWPESVSYDQSALNAFRVSRCQRYIDSGAYRTDQSAGVGLLQLLLDTFSRPISIVDFGGAFGEFGLSLMHRNPGLVASYVVVESAGMVAATKQLTMPFPIEMVAAIPTHPMDIFFTSGTLQYIDDWASVAKAGFAVAGRYAVFARNSFSEERIIRLQASDLASHGQGTATGSGGDVWVRSPHSTVSKLTLLRLAADAGFELFASLESSSGAIPFKNKVTGGDLVFRRRQG